MGEPMFVIVGAKITVKHPSEELVEWCKRELEIPNPEYTKKQRMGFWVGRTPKTLCLYEWNGADLVLPYGCIDNVLNADYMVSRFRPNPVEFGCEIPLYEYQTPAVDAMVAAGNGILQAPAGSGKTQMALAIASALGGRTLWLTHTVDLLNQSKERAERYMDKRKIGTITGGKVCLGECITFATVQTMSNLDLTQYRYWFDTVIVDECHRLSGSPTTVTMFSKVLNSIAAPHKYGVSATVHRADGLIKATYSMLGDVKYVVPRSAVADKIMDVTVEPINTGVGLSRAFMDTDGTLVYAKLINYLAENEERNQQIVSNLVENREHYCLVLSDRLCQLEWLMNHLPPELREQAVMVDGKMTSKKAKAAREQAMDDMREGRKRYLFATYSLAKEGLDIPRLDRLFLATPQKDYAVIVQSIGRVARTFEGKDEPIAYDYVDGGIPYCVKAFKKRKTSCLKIGCTVT